MVTLCPGLQTQRRSGLQHLPRAVDHHLHRRVGKAARGAMLWSSRIRLPPPLTMMSSILMRWGWCGVSWSSPTTSSFSA